MSYRLPNDSVIELRDVAKSFRMQRKPMHRLFELLLPTAFQRSAHSERTEEFTALKDIDFDLRSGEVLGVVGLNGAGKSTLLQLVAGTLRPSKGSIRTHGRVAALLELGSGFNPEFTGRENIRLNAAILGLTRQTIEERLDEIIAFADIGEHIDQPVKTYSSGMQMRLAFAVATSVDADVLLIDEALSVGDGAFARKSFDRMLQVKQRGVSVLFCSHVLFHVEVFCDRVIWLDKGRIRATGPAKAVLAEYQEYLDELSGERAQGVGERFDSAKESEHSAPSDVAPSPVTEAATTPSGHARILSVDVSVDGQSGVELRGLSGEASLRMKLSFKSDLSIPTPSAALVISSQGGRIIGTNLSINQPTPIFRDDQGCGVAIIDVAPLRMNKGVFRIGAYLLCERGIHVYQWIDPVATVEIHRNTHDQGYWMVEGRWSSGPTQPT